MLLYFVDRFPISMAQDIGGVDFLFLFFFQESGGEFRVIKLYCWWIKYSNY